MWVSMHRSVWASWLMFDEWVYESRSIYGKLIYEAVRGPHGPEDAALLQPSPTATAPVQWLPKSVTLVTVFRACCGLPGLCGPSLKQ